MVAILENGDFGSPCWIYEITNSIFSFIVVKNISIDTKIIEIGYFYHL